MRDGIMRQAADLIEGIYEGRIMRQAADYSMYSEGIYEGVG